MSSTFQCRQQESTVGFAADSLAVQVNEGGTATLTVTRVGTERVCAAKDPSTITCEQPANHETVCPNSADCAFTADPSGGSQGSCSLTTQTDCDASLEDDADGTTCMALGCAYTHGSLGAGSVAFTTEDGTAVSTADDDWGRTDTPDFEAVSGRLEFRVNEVEATTTIDVTALVDGVYDEVDKSFRIRLSAPESTADSTGHVQLHLADDTDLLVAEVTIVDTELCAGWPAELPVRALEPCSYSERDDSSINCTARGLCPADDPDLQQHPEHPDH